MNLSLIESKIAALENLLCQNPLLWQNEILSLYLQDKIPEAWLSEQFLLTPEQIFEFDFTKTLPVDHPWSSFSKDLLQSMTIPPVIPHHDFASQMPKLQSLTEKKSYEIRKIMHLFDHLGHLHSDDHVVDLAGGKGHLSKTLQQYFSQLNISRSVIDSNIQFYQENLQNFRSSQEHFFCLDLLHLSKLPIELDHCHLLQLHGCGSLSDQAMSFFQNSRAQSLMLVGCCYHHIKEHIHFHHYPQLSLTPHALYLATRTYKKLNSLHWQRRLNQKHYRYTFEMWFDKKFGTSMPALKSSRAEYYMGPFVDYAKIQLQRLGLKFTSFDLRALEKCYVKDFTLRESLIKLGIIRMMFARPIEVYIALRRAQKLLHGKCDKIIFGEIFEHPISPRNIVLFALKKN